MENITVKEVNELVTLWFENYQSVIALAEGAFDPFGYVELHNPEDAEELGLETEVAQAIFNFPKDAWYVYENQIKISKIDNKFSYVLLDIKNEVVFHSDNLYKIIDSEQFKIEMGSLDADNEVKKLCCIIQEAFVTSQSFMDEEPYWGNENYLIPTSDTYFLSTNELFFNENGKSLLEIYSSSHPVDQLVNFLKNNEELTPEETQRILAMGTEIKPRTLNEICLLLENYDAVDLDPDLTSKLTQFNKNNGTRIYESELQNFLFQFSFENKTPFDMETLYSIASKGGETSYSYEAVNGYIQFKKDEVAEDVYDTLIDDWGLGSELYNLGIFNVTDFQNSMLNYEKNILEKAPTYFRGEGGSYALKNEDGEWEIKQGQLFQGLGFKSYEAYDYVKEHFSEEVKKTIPIYSGELDDSETFHTFESILDDVQDVLENYDDSTKNVPIEVKYGLVDSVIQTVDWQQPLSVLNETNLEEEVKYYIEPLTLGNESTNENEAAELHGKAKSI